MNIANIDLTKKSYVIDSNVIENDPDALTILSNGCDNNIIVLYSVLAELDSNSVKSFQSKEALRLLKSYTKDNIYYLNIPKGFNNKITHESKIQEFRHFVNNLDCKHPNEKNVVFVSTDTNFLLKAKACKVNADVYKNLNPHLGDSQKYSGVYKEGQVPEDLVFINGFEWKPSLKQANPYVFHTKKGVTEHVPEMELWGVSPITNYQNMAMYAMMHPDIPLVSIQSCAGLGKTYLALAAAFTLMFDPKYKDSKYNKIFITKPTIEIGESLGFLPGDKEEKMAPYVRNILDLVFKLHDIRGVSRIFKKSKNNDKMNDTSDEIINKHEFKTSKFEVLPINYIRGMNIDNAIVIIDEPQNLTRGEIRTLLTRMGQNVKCFCIGDTSQVDHHLLDEGNNGLNWMVRLLRGEKGYAHLVLKGQQSRGPITDMIIKNKL